MWRHRIRTFRQLANSDCVAGEPVQQISSCFFLKDSGIRAEPFQSRLFVTSLPAPSSHSAGQSRRAVEILSTTPNGALNASTRIRSLLGAGRVFSGRYPLTNVADDPR
jgi:hypothetical protein